MKRILYILLPLALTVTACEDFLDEQPVSELSATSFWKTRDDIIAGIAGMYDGIQSVVDDRYIDWGEGRSDNLTNGGTGVTEINFALNALTANMSNVNWDQLYATIGRANLAIKNIPLISGVSEKDKNNFLAQAHAMRAFAHFTGVKVWGDVPLMLEAVTDRNFRPTRTPANEVLNKVVEDLNLALTLVDPANANVYELNNGAILAILMDAYMWQKDYQKAFDTSEKIIKLNRYALVAGPVEWNNIFVNPSTSKEAIWSIFWSFEQDGSNGISGKIGSSTNTSPFELDDNLLAKWETQKKDFRRYLTYDTLQAPTAAVSDIYKHYPLINGKQILPPTNQTEVRNSMYRYADILLMRAEAYNKLGNRPEALKLLNQVKVRAGVKPVLITSFQTEKSMETAILDERQFELFAEGKRWFDLRRTDRVIEVMDPLLRLRQAGRNLPVTGFGDPGLILFPISRDALNENPNLVQNRPYSD